MLILYDQSMTMTEPSCIFVQTLRLPDTCYRETRRSSQYAWLAAAAGLIPGGRKVVYK